MQEVHEAQVQNESQMEKRIYCARRWRISTYQLKVWTLWLCCNVSLEDIAT